MKATENAQRPNILFIMVDEYRFPRFGYGSKAGMRDPIKNILGFQGKKLADLEPYAHFFPGLLGLRKYAVVLRRHTIATSACMPSRAAIFTGQYQTRNGVSQTNGLFKNGDAKNYSWLQPEGIPTIGDWFRAAGYQTHYFGKCHFANPPDHSLERFGFEDWERSYPEPHGSSPNNLGFFRDHGFADLVTQFLRRRALGLENDRRMAELEVRDPQAGPLKKKQVEKEAPWFAVASFTNPHDIATYPVLLRQLEGQNTLGGGPLQVPAADTFSILPTDGTWSIPLNPGDFPKYNAFPSPSQHEDLTNKPDCQFDYSLKMGMALAAKSGQAKIVKKPNLLGLPFQLTANPKKSAMAFLDYYTYVHYVVDQHIERLLTTLEETGLRGNTIVVFTSDHGEYGAAHGMMIQKWHTGYQEAIHVPVVVSSPLVNNSDEMRQVDALTSHIDLLPTLLGLAGIDAVERRELMEQLRIYHDVPEPVGADLSAVILGKRGARVIEPTGEEREGVLFATDDMITEPLPPIDDPHSKDAEKDYKAFVTAVKWYRTNSHPAHSKWKPLTSRLKPGSVCQPCHVRCVRTERFKLVRYCDLSSVDPVADQWEMYDLKLDPNEMANLLAYDQPFPTVFTPATPAKAKRVAAALIVAEAKRLRSLLEKLEARMLAPGGYGYKPSAVSQ